MKIRGSQHPNFFKSSDSHENCLLIGRTGSYKKSVLKGLISVMVRCLRMIIPSAESVILLAPAFSL